MQGPLETHCTYQEGQMVPGSAQEMSDDSLDLMSSKWADVQDTQGYLVPSLS